MPKKKTKENPAEQSEAFRQTAREIGADANTDTDDVMRRLAKQKKRQQPLKKAP